MSRTRTIESAAVLVLDDEIVYLNLSQFSTKVPIMVVIKAMGMESGDEFKRMVGPDPKYLDLFESSVRVRKPKEEDGAMDILREIFLCNIPVDGNNFRKKCIFVAVMVRRIFEAHYNIVEAHYIYNILEADSNKEILDDLDLFKDMNEEAKKFHDSRSEKHPKINISTVSQQKLLFQIILNVLKGI